MLEIFNANRLKKNLNSKRFSPKAITALLIFGAIVLVFVFFGMPAKQNQTGTGAAATVNSSLISVSDLRNETQRLEQMYGQLFGGQMGGDAQRQFLRQQALENLITGEVIAGAAQKEGVMSTDAEIRDFITKEVPVFQKDGKFSREAYQGYLDYTHSSAGDFEEKIRKDRKTQRTRRLMEIAAQPTDLEVKKAKSLKEQRMNVGFVKIEKDNYIKKFKATDSEIKNFIASADFEKKAQEYYKAHTAEFSQDAEVHAQHILLKTDQNDPTSDQKVLAKIKEIQKKAATEDFGKLAAQFSEDPGSKAKNGDLGFFSKGRMVPDFETAAFSQNVGAVGEPVKTNYGYHLIKVLAKKEAKTISIEEAKNKIADELIANDKYDGFVKSLEEALAKNDAASVEAILKSAGLNWEETGFFDLSADAIPKLTGTAATDAAFELNAKYTLLNHLVRDGGTKYVLKLKDSKTEAQADNKNFAQELAKQKSNELFSEWIEKHKKSAKIERNQQVLESR